MPVSLNTAFQLLQQLCNLVYDEGFKAFTATYLLPSTMTTQPFKTQSKSLGDNHVT